jgi:hypothetical protein
LINTKGVVVVEPTYQIIKPFVGGFANVKLNDKWGVIDKTGKIKVAIEYDDLGDMYKNTTWAKKGTVFGLVFDNKFTPVDGAVKIWDFEHQDLTYAKKGDKIGFIDLKGKWVIEPKFDKARAFVKNIAPVCEGKKWGYINTKGEYIVKPAYSDAEIFSEDGLAPVRENEWGFIDTTGKLVIPAKYQITAGGFAAWFRKNDKGFVGGLARVAIKSEKKWMYLKTDGSILGNKKFDNAELFQK